MSELRINNITDRVGSSGPIIAGVSTVTSTTHMTMPSGPTEMRGGRGRGVFAGGANDFGDMIIAPLTNFALSNATRGITAGGLTAPTPSYTCLLYTSPSPRD